MPRSLLAPATLLLASSFLSFAADLRPPAVPLIVHDPYISVWSMADHLNEAQTKHWTGTNQQMCSLVRVDGKTFRLMGADPKNTPAFPQTARQVMPTHTEYVFQGSGVEVKMTFLNPSLPSDLELVSRPVTYITWSARAVDGANHSVQIYFDASSLLTVNTQDQAVNWDRFRAGELQVLRMGSKEQSVLARSGDDLRIDWGHLYVTAPAGSNQTEAATLRPMAIDAFNKKGKLPDHDELEAFEPYAQPLPVLAEAFDFNSISGTSVSRHLLIAYDEEYAVEYLHRRLRPYWRRNGKGIADLLETATREYEELNRRAEAFDKQLMADLTATGGEKYAALGALAFPQTIAAHTLVADTDGTLLYFSKENFSNGSIDTVDITYPSSPFFLLFNPRLLQAQIQPILDYASLPRWHFPFAPHDLGRYPLANGQQYGGGEKTEENQMPVEESGNMLLVVAGLVQVDGRPDFARQYWPLLTKWAEYLRDKGLDPENQLSTDDFAGHLAHNANLSAKAILAMAAYGKMAGALGHADVQKQYSSLAHDYATRWVKMAEDGDHYKLAFDRPGTWSQKYNLVWDQLLQLKVFSRDVIEKELIFYAGHTNTYGLPLDNRADYTKLDWLAWTGALAQSKDGFEKIFDPAFRFANESPSRVPLTDWYDTKTGKQVGFQARSVVGGIFVQMLTDPKIWAKYAHASSAQ